MGASLRARTLSSTRSSENNSNHSGRSRTVSLSPFLFHFSISAGSCDGLTRAVLLVLSLLVDAGRNVRTTASCNSDVGEEGLAELKELVDTPGKTIGT